MWLYRNLWFNGFIISRDLFSFYWVFREFRIIKEGLSKGGKLRFWVMEGFIVKFSKWEMKRWGKYVISNVKVRIRLGWVKIDEFCYKF